jgi:hypothetical protein
MNGLHLCSGFGESQPSWPGFRVSAEMLIASHHDIGPGDRPLRLSSDGLRPRRRVSAAREMSRARPEGEGKFHLQFTPGKASFTVDVVQTKLLRLLDHRAYLGYGYGLVGTTFLTRL